jgi:hypothetical protein
VGLLYRAARFAIRADVPVNFAAKTALKPSCLLFAGSHACKSTGEADLAVAAHYRLVFVA